MDDYYEYNDAQDLRLSILETSEGADRGLVKWCVEAKDSNLGWYWLTSPSRPMSYDLALAYARVELMYHEQRLHIKGYDGPTPPSPDAFDAAKCADEAARDASEAESEE